MAKFGFKILAVLSLWMALLLSTESFVFVPPILPPVQRRGRASVTVDTRPVSFRLVVPTLHLVDDDQEVVFGSSGVLDTASSDTTDSSLWKSLQRRQSALQQGVGKRYVTRTQKGFLNVHYEPTDPHDMDNVVGQLQEGQIVTSTGPTRGFWVPHDGGGWSISKYGGFTWLEPIDE